MKQYKMMIVGEAYTEEEALEGAPFLGASGNTLNMLFAAAGINRKEVYLTNVFNCRPSPSSNNVAFLCGPRADSIAGYTALQSGKYVRAELKPELDRLYAEINKVNPNVIVALGPTATWALLNEPKMKRLRGAPALASGIAASRIGDRKIIATYHPTAVNRDWSLRPIVMADLTKAVREAEFPDIRRPEREFWLYPTVEDLYEFERRYLPEGCDLSIDIETAREQITCVGIGPSPNLAIVVPFVDAEQVDGNYWRTKKEELHAWLWVKRLCETHPSLGQNFIYDMHYLWRTMGIACPLMKDDTMLMQHSLQPEMEKGLGFLGSIFTDEPAWKFMRAKHETLKKED